MKKAIALSFALLMAAGALAGCNTIEGAGEDIERGGQEIEEAAE
ncbi:MAG: entericidin A/B family lipoprotein [Halomonas sp.]|uniref:Entericidin A/B family lipoprotein n=2 Tax=Halomonadaceae TaxID=28256 RepID=A0ABS6ZT54_9GAMM|nr:MULTISPECIES: entericidin A/B family lipoprotein [Halomonas]MBW6393224.1 entericidin A/B family lipoprotein [Halomonas antri]MDX5378571.1 entericidin A/B family lipoprotein [Halomonas sp.]QTP60717.1 entericidin A/B family lipoprotein [Halomonas sulfidivorans]